MKNLPIAIPKFPNTNGMTTLAVAIDLSGSTSNQMLDIIREAMNKILASLIENGSFKMTVWAFDNVVQYKSITEFTHYNCNDFESKIDHVLTYGRGGSSYDESFYLVKALALNPDALVFITDNYMSSPQEPAASIAESLETYVIYLHNVISLDDMSGVVLHPVPFKSHVIPVAYSQD